MFIVFLFFFFFSVGFVFRIKLVWDACLCIISDGNFLFSLLCFFPTWSGFVSRFLSLSVPCDIANSTQPSNFPSARTKIPPDSSEHPGGFYTRSLTWIIKCYWLCLHSYLRMQKKKKAKAKLVTRIQKIIEIFFFDVLFSLGIVIGILFFIKITNLKLPLYVNLQCSLAFFHD